MLSGHMLLSSLKMYFFTLRHRPPPVFPMSHSSSNQHLRPFPLRALIPFHLFLIDTLYFSGRQLRPGSKNTSTQVQQSNTVVVLLSCGGGLLHKLCLTPFLFLVGLTQYTHRCSCSSWLSIPMTTGVRAIATGRWREDRVKAAQKYTLFCVSKYSKYTPLVQHWIEETKNRERMEPKRGIICEMRAGNPSPNVLISQKCLTPGGTLSLQVILIALCAWRRSLSNEFLSISYYLDISTHTPNSV